MAIEEIKYLKRKLLTAIFVLLTFSALSQTKIGWRGGMNFARMWNDFKIKNRVVTRINIGTMIEIPIDDNWLLYTGPYYSGKGVIFGRSHSTNKIDSFTIRLNYIELPLNIAYKFSAESENRLVIAAGPYFSYGFNGQESIRNCSCPPSLHLHKKEKDQYKRMELGVNLIALYEINSKYGVRLDCSSSISTIEKCGNVKNLVFGFSFFWYLRNKNDSEE